MFAQNSDALEPFADSFVQLSLEKLVKENTMAVHIDGSIMEGGGQILRMSSLLSTLLRKEVKIEKIRAGRSKPGLRPQHLAGLSLLADLSHGKLDNGYVESTSVSFKPGQATIGTYHADPGTAGSITLMMQTSIPALALVKSSKALTTESVIRFKGGTNVDFAPQIDDYLAVFQPVAKKFGLQFKCDIHRRGFFPKGGGEVHVAIPANQQFKSVTMIDRGTLESIEIRSWVAGTLPLKLAKESAHAAERYLSKSSSAIPNFDQIRVNTVTEQFEEGNRDRNGNGLILIGQTSTGCTLSSSGLGKRGVTPGELGESAGKAFYRNLMEEGGCVDEHVQDQIIILMALASGKSCVRTGPLTMHTQTAIHIAEFMTQAKFSVKEDTDDQGDGGRKKSMIIECEGIGYDAEIQYD